eukprot:5173898-Pyramimonas_sp.AAC.1
MEVATQRRRFAAQRGGRVAPRLRALFPIGTRQARLREAGHSCDKTGEVLVCQICVRTFLMGGPLRRFHPGPCAGPKDRTPEASLDHP